MSSLKLLWKPLSLCPRLVWKRKRDSVLTSEEGEQASQGAIRNTIFSRGGKKRTSDEEHLPLMHLDIARKNVPLEAAAAMVTRQGVTGGTAPARWKSLGP